MKRGLLFTTLLCVIFSISLFAQTTITFTGKDNLDHYVQLHHIEIENLTQNWTDTLYYPDTILIMSGVGLTDYEFAPDFSVSQNVPNPFDGVTDFTMTLPYDDQVAIAVTDMSGRKVTERSVRLHAGTHTFRVWLSTPQSYLLTVKTSRDAATIKMLNNGNAGHNHIEYRNDGPLAYELRATKSGNHPFAPGDQMRFVGVTLSDNTFYYSDTIEQALYGDETFELLFQLWEQVAIGGSFVCTDTLFIPDGIACNGSCVGIINIPVTGYPSGLTIQDDQTIRYLRMKMEHSFIGDLWIALTCPNGQMATVLQKYNSSGGSECSSLIPASCWGWQTSGSSGVYFGQYYKPDVTGCDPSQNPTGICWNYCWSNNVLEGYQYACSNALVYETCNHIYAENPSPNGQSNSSYVDSTDVANMTNVYHPDQPFASLVGCPLNGLWQIKIIDGWSQDNGYVVEAELALPQDTSYIQVNVPTVVTGEANAIGYHTATCTGMVVNDGFQMVTERGICWDTLPNPTLATDFTVEGQGLGTFSSVLDSLEAGTTYYYRAYATNSAGTTYGSELTFVTLPNALPTVTTAAVTDILDVSAVSGGTVNDDGGLPIIEQGICWGMGQDPTLADSHVADLSGQETFTCTIHSITAGNTYYVRAYATNAVGTAYGNSLSFTTTDAPSGITANYTYVSNTEADVTGNIASNGGTTLTERGFCWSVAPFPTLQDDHVAVSGTATGSFTGHLSGLVPGTTYYVNAYATNNVGTTYSVDVQFTTSSMPVVTTSEVYSVTLSSAVAGGTVVHTGGLPIIDCGVCLSTEPEPTMNDQTVSASAGPGDFVVNLDGLDANTKYYVRAYVVNSTNTAYGETVSFVTDDSAFVCGVSTIRDYDDNIYQTVAIGTQCWMKENMRTTHLPDGTQIPLSATASATTAARCYPNGNADNVAQFGYLYSWCATMNGNPPANNRGICPEGWHVPSKEEWQSLFSYVGSRPPYACGGNSGYYGKALAADHTWSGASGACNVGNSIASNNATDFSMIPAGENDGSYLSFKSLAAFHSSHLQGSSILNIYFYKNDPYVFDPLSTMVNRMLSVRCLRDMPLNMPSLVVITNALDSITTSSAHLSYSVSVYNTDTIINSGVCWSTEPSPSIADNSISSISLEAGNHSISLTDLESNTVYYVRAYASNTFGTVYGRQRMFRTVDSANAGSATLIPILPIVKTVNIANAFNGTSAYCDGNVLFDGNSTVTERGICWGINPEPTASGSHVVCGTGTGPFMGKVNGVSPGNVFYIRAYATNSVGTAYGEELVLIVPVLPNLTTLSVTGVEGTSAICNGTVTHDGYGEILARGFCWDTVPDPTLAANITVDGVEMGAFSHTLTGLVPNTTYHVRAYVTNKVGTNYGSDVTFTTTAVPVITTASVTNISYQSATAGGQNIVDNGDPITEKGICWSTQSQPDINGQHLAVGSGTSAFTGTLTGLTPGYRYYVRAYATNSNGTAYGQEVSFVARNDANPCPGDTTVTDIEGNVYHTVQLGEQCWLKENLRTNHYADGSYFTESYYPNNDIANVPTYGLMYKWATIMHGAASSEIPGAVQGLCPDGWHLPSYSEFQMLQSYSNATYSCASKALASTTGWHYFSLTGCYPGYSPQLNNESGFSAYPTGSPDSHPVLCLFSYSTSFWSATMHHSNNYSTCSYALHLRYDDEFGAGITWYSVNDKMPVRCVRNE